MSAKKTVMNQTIKMFTRWLKQLKIGMDEDKLFRLSLGVGIDLTEPGDKVRQASYLCENIKRSHPALHGHKHTIILQRFITNLN